MQIIGFSFLTCFMICDLKEDENEINESSSIILFVLCSVFQFMLLIMPYNTFAIFYVNVCHHLKQVLEEFHKYMRKEHSFDYYRLLKSHNSIVSKAEHVDSELSTILFYCIIFNSLTVHVRRLFSLSQPDKRILSTYFPDL